MCHPVADPLLSTPVRDASLLALKHWAFSDPVDVDADRMTDPVCRDLDDTFEVCDALRRPRYPGGKHPIYLFVHYKDLE